MSEVSFPEPNEPQSELDLAPQPIEDIEVEVVDDRPSVIRMWRELGGLTVIDVGQGLEF